MKEVLSADLSTGIDPTIVRDLLETYAAMLAKRRAGDAESALTKAGKFVEHTFRALEFVRAGTVVAEIKSPSATAKTFENDASLPESIRLLVPRIALGMIYDLRSKRGAVHVKAIDPRQIDVDLTVAAASWILAEFVRLYHCSEEEVVARAMEVLSRSEVPCIERIGGEPTVTAKVSAEVEVLLLLADARPDGLARGELCRCAKCSQRSVDRAVDKLIDGREVHRTNDSKLHITGVGDARLSVWLAGRGKIAA